MRVLAWNHHGHVVVKDVDRQVVALLTQQLLRLLLEHDSSAVVRVDDVVSDLELDQRNIDDFEVGDRRLVDYLLC